MGTQFRVSSCSKIIFKSCIFLQRILTGNKVESYLHRISLPDFFHRLLIKELKLIKFTETYLFDFFLLPVPGCVEGTKFC